MDQDLETRITNGIKFFRNLTPEQRLKLISLKYLDAFLNLVERHIQKNSPPPPDGTDPDDNTSFAEKLFTK